jgi:hypothetical protein
VPDLLPGARKDTAWVETTSESTEWARENAAEIEAKRAEYFPKWLQKRSDDRPTLLPEDGRP